MALTEAHAAMREERDAEARGRAEAVEQLHVARATVASADSAAEERLAQLIEAKRSRAAAEGVAEAMEKRVFGMAKMRQQLDTRHQQARSLNARSPRRRLTGAPCSPRCALSLSVWSSLRDRSVTCARRRPPSAAASRASGPTPPRGAPCGARPRPPPPSRCPLRPGRQRSRCCARRAHCPRSARAGPSPPAPTASRHAAARRCSPSRRLCSTPSPS